MGKVRSELDFGDSGILTDLNGWFEADSKSVTMGEAELDHTIHGAIFLNISKHPTVRFEIESASTTDSNPPAASIEGSFKMKEIDLPVEAKVDFDLMVGPTGNELLGLQGTFVLPLTPFDMEGPDGPANAKDKLLFDVNLAYERMN